MCVYNLIKKSTDAYKRRAIAEHQLQQQFYIDSMPRDRLTSLNSDIEHVVQAQVIQIYGFIFW